MDNTAMPEIWWDIEPWVEDRDLWRGMAIDKEWRRILQETHNASSGFRPVTRMILIRATKTDRLLSHVWIPSSRY